MAIRDLTRVTASLDAPVGEGDTTLGELHAESTDDLEDEVLEREQEQAVEAALAQAARAGAADHQRALRHRRTPRAQPARRGPRGRGDPGAGAAPRGARDRAACRPTTRSRPGAKPPSPPPGQLVGRVWVLDTDTKGTGAEMVPLETLLERKRSTTKADPAERNGAGPSTRRRGDRPRDRRSRTAAAAEPRRRHEFRLVNALSGRLIGDGVDVRATCELLGAARSVADVRVYARASARKALARADAARAAGAAGALHQG